MLRCERTQDVDHEVRQWTSITRQVLEDDIDTFRLKVALDDRQVRDVTAEPVDIINKYSLEQLLPRGIAQSVQGWPAEQCSAPAIVDIFFSDNIAARLREGFKFFYLRFNCPPLSLLVSTHAAVESHAHAIENEDLFVPADLRVGIRVLDGFVLIMIFGGMVI